VVLKKRGKKRGKRGKKRGKRGERGGRIMSVGVRSGVGGEGGFSKST